MLHNPDLKLPQQLRFHCRNPRCGGKLPAPVDNPRDAFCCSGCDKRFYSRRCRVCENLFDPGMARKQVCGRNECRYQFKTDPERFFGSRSITPQNSKIAHNARANPIKIGVKTSLKSGRAFRIIADPEVPASKANREFREHIRQESAKALFQRDVPPLNILGGFKFPDAPQVDLSSIPKAAPQASARPIQPLSPELLDDDGTGIPRFLRRVREDEAPAPDADQEHV